MWQKIIRFVSSALILFTEYCPHFSISPDSLNVKHIIARESYDYISIIFCLLMQNWFSVLMKETLAIKKRITKWEKIHVFCNNCFPLWFLRSVQKLCKKKHHRIHIDAKKSVGEFQLKWKKTYQNNNRLIFLSSALYPSYSVELTVSKANAKKTWNSIASRKDRRTPQLLSSEVRYSEQINVNCFWLTLIQLDYCGCADCCLPL